MGARQGLWAWGCQTILFSKGGWTFPPPQLSELTSTAHTGRPRSAPPFFSSPSFREPHLFHVWKQSQRRSALPVCPVTAHVSGSPSWAVSAVPSRWPPQGARFPGTALPVPRPRPPGLAGLSIPPQLGARLAAPPAPGPSSSLPAPRPADCSSSALPKRPSFSRLPAWHVPFPSPGAFAVGPAGDLLLVPRDAAARPALGHPRRRSPPRERVARLLI